MTPDIGLAASARPWPDQLHRFVLDHGGARVVDRIMSPDQALQAPLDVLVIDDVCSFLTPALVDALRRSGKEVVGVYAPEDSPSAERRLDECGIAHHVDTTAPPESFLEKIGTALDNRVPEAVPGVEVRSVPRIGVTGPAAGVGTTEIALGLAAALSALVRVCLVDLDDVAPSIAQRCGLPLHPNVRTALDAAVHTPDTTGASMQLIGDLQIIGGVADGGAAPALSRPEVAALTDALSKETDVVVADLGPSHSVSPGFLREFSSLVLVGGPDPVGIARLALAARSLLDSKHGQDLLMVVNRVGRDSFRSTEAVRQLVKAAPEIPVIVVPADARVTDAAWNGNLVGRGAFRKKMAAMATAVAGVVS